MKLFHRITRSQSALILVLIGAGSIIVRILIGYGLNYSALLYVGVPFVLAMSLIVGTDHRNPIDSLWTRYRNIIRLSLIVMLGSSVLLFEGFLCVLIFMPIYFVAVTIAFLCHRAILRARNNSNGTLKAYILPLLILLSAFEGTHENITFERSQSVFATSIVNLGIDEIKNNLKQPIDLDKDRHWFLQLFPMPYDVKAENLDVGAVHEIYYRYKKWFFTNSHEGRTLLKIADVGQNYIRTAVISDTSYLSNYLDFKGTLIELEPLSDRRTQITLNVYFERSLDPAWYFGPLERFAVRKMAEFLIADLMVRGA